MKHAVLAAVFAATIGAPAYAATPAWEFSTTPAGYVTEGEVYNFATKFTVLSSVTVTGLGWFGSINDTSPVALYSCDSAGCLTTGTLRVQGGVDGQATQIGNFSFSEISALTLTPGEYLLAGLTNLNAFTETSNDFLVSPNLTFDETRFEEVEPGSAPNFLTTNATTPFFGVNLLLGDGALPPEPPVVTPDPPAGAVPEPATWAMMILGFGLIGSALRRRRSVTTKVRFA